MSRSSSARERQSRWSLSDGEIVRCGQRVVATEARALVELIGRLDNDFVDVVKTIALLKGSLVVTGMGKAGLIGQKLAATFASTGTRAHFLHPAEAFHGDLGRLHASDAVLALSQSGTTSELLQLLPALRAAAIPLLAITASKTNPLARSARATLSIGQLQEACALGLAPSTSTTAMLALGDAVALVVSQLRGFRAEDFARFHPGGALGRRLSRVEEQMRPLEECRVARDCHTIRQAVIATTRPGRRSGAIMLVDDQGKLAGLFTDSDLARLIEARKDKSLDRPIREAMCRLPTTILAGSMFSAALDLLAERKFSELPVVDEAGRPLGMIDVTDVLDAAEPPAAVEPPAAIGAPTPATPPTTAGPTTTAANKAPREPAPRRASRTRPSNVDGPPAIRIFSTDEE